MHVNEIKLLILTHCNVFLIEREVCHLRSLLVKKLPDASCLLLH